MADLKKKLIKYIAGEITLPNFTDWFIPEYWNVHRRNDEKLTELVYN